MKLLKPRKRPDDLGFDPQRNLIDPFFDWLHKSALLFYQFGGANL